ncbi:MAG: gliding motility protein GldL [Prevotella sp.]|jgi:hypothetical protein|nr:gliding motility protein GldL [Prevotella sp.]
MTKYSKFNPIYRLQKWLDSVPGQTFMNYAYSWGASIVILGALFKLTHLPGANTMLFLGMGTEVLVFFIAGFDRPFDKTEEGKELPTHVSIEGAEDEGVAVSGVSGMSGGTIIIGGGGSTENVGGEGLSEGAEGVSGGIISGGGVIGGGGYVGGGYAGGYGSGVAGEGEEGAPAEGFMPGEGGSAVPVSGGIIGGGIIGGVAAPQQPELPDIDAEEMEEATQNYVEQLKSLTETLKKVSEQSERLTRDSEEMENLNRTLTGICKVYEMQLKGASQQIGTIDQINEQSKRMAEQIAELNKIYTRMIEAMTVNMPKINNNGN